MKAHVLKLTQTVRMALVQQSDRGIVNTQSLVVAGGLLNFTFPGMLQSGQAYNVDYYADVNGNGQCGGNDHIWREVVPAAARAIGAVESDFMPLNGPPLTAPGKQVLLGWLDAGVPLSTANCN